MVDQSNYEVLRQKERWAKQAHYSHKMREGELKCPVCKEEGSPLIKPCTGPKKASS